MLERVQFMASGHGKNERGSQQRRSCLSAGCEPHFDTRAVVKESKMLMCGVLGRALVIRESGHSGPRDRRLRRGRRMSHIGTRLVPMRSVKTLSTAQRRADRQGGSVNSLLRRAQTSPNTPNSGKLLVDAGCSVL
jgi:hypothetical protein